jgi:ABC-type lipoprotein export system ATPase subunit
MASRGWEGDDTMAQRANLRGFRAEGILGGVSYDLSVSGAASIIVGPNGTGKSTFLSLFYLFLSRQWTRLLEYDFERLTLFHDDGEISMSKSDMLSLDVLPHQPLRIRNYLSRLSDAGLIDTALKSTVTRTERETIASVLRVPPEEVSMLRRYLTRDVAINKKAIGVDRALQQLGLGKILYMPTYRRIEKDIKSIFPDIEERFRVRLTENQITARAGASFQEIVSFGMDDIRSLIKSYIDEVKDFHRMSSETASQEYIRDIVRGRVKTYSLRGIRDLNDTFVEDFIERLDPNLFASKDKEELRKQIEILRRRTRGQPNKDMRYLGFFVEKMLAAHQKVKERELPLLRFGEYIAKYLGSNKIVSFNNLDFQIRDALAPTEINLDQLSSGEKQILSIFAYLLLKKDRDYIIFIDEPELSLSVPWQKSFLTDLLATNRCSHLFAVTHSPFVFDNHLRHDVIDVSKLRLK